MVHLKTFGGLSVAEGDAPGSGAAQQRKTLALLALVAAAGRNGVSRDKLVALLWPEADLEHARGLLKQACYALRRDLHQPDLLLGTAQLRLNSSVITSDVQAFEAALERRDDAEAVELYVGPFLDGFYLKESAEFERWVEAERGRLHHGAGEALERRDDAEAVELYVGPFLDGFYLNDLAEFERWVEAERGRLHHGAGEALERLATAAAARGEHVRSVAWWRRLAALDPLNSRVALGLMNALVARGDWAGALQVAREHQSLLREELSATPDAGVEELAERLRAEGEGHLPARLRASASPEVGVALSGAPAKTPAGALPGAVVTTRSSRHGPRRLVMVSVALVAVVVAVRAFPSTARVMWARSRGIPSLQSHVAAGNWEAAYRLAARLEAIIPNDSAVAAMRSTVADAISIEGSPAGTRVYRKAYNGAGTWEFMGVAPIAHLAIPRLPVVSQFRFESPGGRTALDIGAARPLTGANAAMTVPGFSLLPDAPAPEGMVWVAGGDVATGIPQLPADRARIADFYLDRLEITNREYQVFVDSGGYQRRDLWPREFVKDGRRLSWEEAIRAFVDLTGRAGPSTWEGGRHPPDRADYPVGGVSWYEAAAYAAFRG